MYRAATSRLGCDSRSTTVTTTRATNLAGRLAAAPALGQTLDAAADGVGARRVGRVLRLRRRGNLEVDASTYLAADLGDGLTGWVHVPGYPAPLGLSARRPTHGRDGYIPPPNGHVHQVNLGIAGSIIGTNTGPTTNNFGDGRATR